MVRVGYEIAGSRRRRHSTAHGRLPVLALLLALSPHQPAFARDAAALLARPTEVAPLKAFDVLERHCARCHQSGKLERPRPAAELGNIMRLDEIARDAHLVRPGNPDASRLYTMMIGRRMPYDIFHEAAAREPPGADDIDIMRTWIATLPPGPKPCGGRAFLSADAQRIAMARDIEAQPADRRAHVRYLSLAPLWNACRDEAYLDAARQAAHWLVAGLAREDSTVRLTAIDTPRVLLRVDLAALQLPALVWDQLAQLSPYADRPEGSSAAPDASPPPPLPTPAETGIGSAAWISSRPVRLDWLAFLLAGETSKRLDAASNLSAETRAFVKSLTAGPVGLEAMRAGDSDARRRRLAQAGLTALPAFDQIDMTDLLARDYERDLGPSRIAAELDTEATALPALLERAGGDARLLALHVAQGGIPRRTFETLYRAVAAALTSRPTAAPPERTASPVRPHETVGLSTLGRPQPAAGQLFDLEMTPDKTHYVRDEAASFIVRSHVDCHLTLVSVSPSGHAVVLLPNDWDRNTFLPAGKEQSFPREDSPFRLRLDVAGWETIVAGCNPVSPVFDGIQHDFNLEKFTTLGDYGRFLIRAADGIPMTSPATPLGERGAAPKRPERPPPGRSAHNGRSADGRLDQNKPDPAARTAIRFEVRQP